MINQVFNEDCLEGMKRIPDKSVNLICIDPPYNIKKADWDKWKRVSDYVDWVGLVFKECERVLADNGSFYFFHNDFLQIVELQNWINKNTRFVFKQFIVWDKFNGSKWNQVNAVVFSDGNRNYSKQAEYCLFYTFQDETGLTMVKHDENNFSTLRQYFEDFQKDTGLNKKQIINLIGQKADHCFRWGSSQWDLPTEETYRDLLLLPSLAGFKRREYESLRREYESLRYTFNNIGKSSVWQYPAQPQNGHITPKPIDLIENIIEHSSNENDIVLDCFMGSGTTAIACINTGRNYIGFEKEEKYYKIIQDRIAKHTAQLKMAI